jgi:hypothetical protein
LDILEKRKIKGNKFNGIKFPKSYFMETLIDTKYTERGSNVDKDGTVF